MAIKILPASADDAADMFEVGIKAFAHDPYAKAMFDVASATPEEFTDYKQWRVTLSKSRMSGPTSHYFKAVDEDTGAIAGYTGLNGPNTEPMPSSTVPTPKSINSALHDEFMVKQKAAMQAFLSGRKDHDFWYVQSMAVHPDYQGQGVATKLLSHAMKGADEAEQAVYLEGTPAAESLYLRFGFELVEDIVLMDGTYIMKAMIRHPRKLAK